MAYPGMLTPLEEEKVRAELVSATQPLFFFHDDPDGLASFLLFYRAIRQGRGYAVKAYPHITTEYLRRVEEYSPDKVFILDVAMVDQEFIDKCPVPVIWIDHHTPQEREHVLYVNSRHKDNANAPTPIMCWQLVGDERPEDLWIATVGAIGDWAWPPYAEEFRQKYPDLLPAEIKTVEEALFNPASKVATLVKLFSFNLKGTTSDVVQSVKILTRITSPYEILNQETPQARFVYKKFLSMDKEYAKLKATALKCVSNDRLLIFTYSQDKLSLTKDLANELLYLYQDKVILLGREKSGEMRCSLRSGPKIFLPEALQRALVGIQGYGGGHEHACGVCVKQEDWERFIENLRRELGL
ncbi:hypothetical protein HY642_03755 [Candidatus Woesearchaeota archaeon]|nr:hypothetical protein [Candidatus Woesearchaeota archaeon]